MNLASRPDAVVRRIVAEATLTLVSACHFGNGEAGDTDMMLLRDHEGTPFIAGSSIAGALRSYLARRLLSASDFAEEHKAEPPELKLLFGADISAVGQGEDDTAEQSAIICDDAFFRGFKTAKRDSVAIDLETGTAKDEAKFDFESLEPGASATLTLELVVRRSHLPHQDVMLSYLQTAMDALSVGEVHLGAKTTRGLGRVQAGAWKIADYRMDDPGDALRWLAGSPPAAGHVERVSDVGIPAVAGAMHLRLTLSLDSSVLVRSAPEDLKSEFDVTQFHSGGGPVLPGTSWAGVLRARACRIANTLRLGQEIVNNIFGPPPGTRGPEMRRSRLIVEESRIEKTEPRVQTRLKIDRFTAGGYEGALFREEATWAVDSGETNVVLDLRLEQSATGVHKNEIALLLQVAKDLWMGDIPVGGEVGIGRGVLLGQTAELSVGDTVWRWEAAGAPRTGRLTFTAGSPQGLEERFFGDDWRDLTRVEVVATQEDA